jgi:adenylosuccinate synthase
MRTAHAVIGANYGDEGKGLITDALAAEHGGRCLVVRHNGGAQAGHTVQTPDGRRHVFSHVGAGASTYLSRFFVAHPMLLLREQERLLSLGLSPRVLLDRAAPVTTPWDMLINQIAETARGHARHGSCGVGFGETIARNLSPPHALVAGDLSDRARLRARLDVIRREHVPARLEALGIAPSDDDCRLLASDMVFERFLVDVERFLEAVELADTAPLRAARAVIFEGAQGLLLDQDRGAFPHVTRSHTGIRNAVALAREAGLERLDVTYVTRAYATRHGDGPLANEVARLPFDRVRDDTNRPHPFQGSLRFGWLDLDRMRQAIAADLGDAAGLDVRHRLAVTCLDQVGDGISGLTYRQHRMRLARRR